MTLPPINTRARESKQVGAELCFLWMVIGISFATYGRNPQVYAPYVVALLFAVAAAQMCVFLLVPWSHGAYAWAGTATTVALSARALSIIVGAIQFHNPNSAAITASGLAITTACLRMFWLYWRGLVAAWHKHEQTVRRQRG